MRDCADIVRRPEHALREEKTGREVAIRTWRPHDDGEHPSVQPHFEWLFDSHTIDRAGPLATSNANDIDFIGVHQMVSQVMPEA
jgi:hypothetical protein